MLAWELTALTSLGIRLSIDDFGTGYSSLSRLRHLPVHALKVDRTFVDDIDHCDCGTLARAIILMAHSLGLTVTGEGVETLPQLAFLEEQGRMGQREDRNLPALSGIGDARVRYQRRASRADHTNDR